MSDGALRAAGGIWLVNRRTGPSGQKGRLRLESDRLVFLPDAAPSDQTVIDLHEVRRVRRILGSPVLEIHLAPGEGQRILGFYFIKPPSAAPAQGLLQMRNRYVRKAATERLREWNRVKKDDVAGWVAAIKSATRS
jgi:hypothetical protein